METSELLGGEIEVDESYFGGTRKGKRGRGAVGKVPVFGLLKRNGCVYVAIIPNVSSATLFPIIRNKIRPNSIVYSDAFRSYDVLDVSEFHHVRINHFQLFADQTNQLNGIENFWNQTKRHMRNFNGIPSKHFHLFIKECEWRFKNRPVANPTRLLSKMVVQVTEKLPTYVSPCSFMPYQNLSLPLNDRELGQGDTHGLSICVK